MQQKTDFGAENEMSREKHATSINRIRGAKGQPKRRLASLGCLATPYLSHLLSSSLSK
jgi:hypothetical protein